MYLSQVLWSIKGPGLFNPAFTKFLHLHFIQPLMICHAVGKVYAAPWAAESPPFLLTSAAYPNTLNLDPDPEFWPNLDPDLRLCYQFWKETFFYRKTVLFFKIVFINYKKILTPEELFNQWSLWIVNYCPKSYTFCLNLYTIFTRVDPDPQSSWIRIQIRIHNTVSYHKCTPQLE